MVDTRTPELLLIREQEWQARLRQPRQPDHPWPASAFHDPTRKPRVSAPSRPAPTLQLRPPTRPEAFVPTARSLKVVALLDPAELLTIALPDGKPRVELMIRLPDRTVTASVSAKSARRAIAAIREHGADAVAAIVQGRLFGKAIPEAGLAVQPKALKPKIQHGADSAKSGNEL